LLACSFQPPLFTGATMKNAIIFAFCLLLVLTQSSVLAVCPEYGAPYNEETQPCPGLFKVQYTDMDWYYMTGPSISGGRTWGRGQCYGTGECWPQFKQPYREDATGPDNNYYYRYLVHEVDEMTASYNPHGPSPLCSVYQVLIFRFPDMGSLGSAINHQHTQ
jgi:hypothetical protein